MDGQLLNNLDPEGHCSPTKELRLSKFDTQGGVNAAWKDEKEGKQANKALIEQEAIIGSLDSKALSSPSRELRLSKFDTHGANVTWKDEREEKQAEAAIGQVEEAFSTIIGSLGDPNPSRGGLEKTPRRAAKALLYFTKGYEEDLQS